MHKYRIVLWRATGSINESIYHYQVACIDKTDMRQRETSPSFKIIIID